MVAVGFLFAFLWSVKNGQYKDTYTPSVRILFDDKDQTNLNKKEQKEENSNPSTK